jgi:two-component system chemotaxis response regulator CheY
LDNSASPAARTIMIVEDEYFFRELLRDILEKEGFSVIAEAADGLEGIEKYRLLRPDLTIMDIFMPEKNGIDATREIVSGDADAKILICSGTGYDEHVEDAIQAGARGVIYKPFFPQEVVDSINKVMSE